MEWPDDGEHPAILRPAVRTVVSIDDILVVQFSIPAVRGTRYSGGDPDYDGSLPLPPASGSSLMACQIDRLSMPHA